MASCRSGPKPVAARRFRTAKPVSAPFGFRELFSRCRVPPGADWWFEPICVAREKSRAAFEKVANEQIGGIPEAMREKRRHAGTGRLNRGIAMAPDEIDRESAVNGLELSPSRPGSSAPPWFLDARLRRVVGYAIGRSIDARLSVCSRPREVMARELPSTARGGSAMTARADAGAADQVRTDAGIACRALSGPPVSPCGSRRRAKPWRIIGCRPPDSSPNRPSAADAARTGPSGRRPPRPCSGRHGPAPPRSPPAGGPSPRPPSPGSWT